jgi:5-methylcytosine-specific restriction endonuclease McrA
MKICKKCQEEKELDQFCKRKDIKDGLHRYCKLCMNGKFKEYYRDNKEEHNIRSNKWIQENKEYHKKLVNEHYHNNKDYYRQWNQNKMEIDPLFRLRHAINALINFHLKEGKSQSSIDYLGCTIQEYKEYIEPMFTPEMNWNNYGSYWEIDHIHPLSKGGSFHYTNTQPLIISVNRTKSNKIF